MIKIYHYKYKEELAMKKLNYIGLDVHKKNIVMGESRNPGESQVTGEFLNTESGVKGFLKKLNKLSEEYELKICYEAGPCGYALKRVLDAKGYSCEIIAPSLIPVATGNRIKTDKRDAAKLARLFRAGELTFIEVPDENKESVRDLVRCRDDIMTDIKRTKQRLNHFLIRQGFNYPGTNWTTGHSKWIQQLKFQDSNLQNILACYQNEIKFLEVQLSDFDKEIEKIAQSEEYNEKVKALCAYRGIGVLTAMIVISEVINFSRFSNPRELMAYLGMVPSEYSSGQSIKKGSITKCGNKRVRRALVEAAHHYRHHPTITIKMKKDLEETKLPFRVAPVKAMKRLNKKYYQMIYRGKKTQTTVVAIARELVGFIWHSMVLVENEIKLAGGNAVGF
jgi:transposase